MACPGHDTGRTGTPRVRVTGFQGDMGQGRDMGTSQIHIPWDGSGWGMVERGQGPARTEEGHGDTWIHVPKGSQCP